jgi:RNA polymerase sigma factor (sigma-70 family)
VDPAEDFAARAEAYRRELRVHCYRLTGSFDEAEDLVQETLLHAWRSRDQLEDGAVLRAWLYKIATNTCLDFLRRLERRTCSWRSGCRWCSAEIFRRRPDEPPGRHTSYEHFRRAVGAPYAQ